ncbi:MAG: hypothetical protein MZW92_18265 [Comamonadaceae bacterium]|nr:hypothetical protein [Comamonadaceae bacterium]
MTCDERVDSDSPPTPAAAPCLAVALLAGIPRWAIGPALRQAEDETIGRLFFSPGAARRHGPPAPVQRAAGPRHGRRQPDGGRRRAPLQRQEHGVDQRRTPRRQPDRHPRCVRASMRGTRAG